MNEIDTPLLFVVPLLSLRSRGICVCLLVFLFVCFCVVLFLFLFCFVLFCFFFQIQRMEWKPLGSFRRMSDLETL